MPAVRTGAIVGIGHYAAPKHSVCMSISRIFQNMRACRGELATSDSDAETARSHLRAGRECAVLAGRSMQSTMTPTGLIERLDGPNELDFIFDCVHLSARVSYTLAARAR